MYVYQYSTWSLAKLKKFNNCIGMKNNKRTIRKTKDKEEKIKKLVSVVNSLLLLC